MQGKTIFVGVDVSKNTLDIAVYGGKDHIRVSNNSEGFKHLVAFLKSLGIALADCWFVFEYTGGYEYRLMQFCVTKKVRYCRISGLEIKRSLGLQRGKNDKIDAMRIAVYGHEKQNRLKPDPACNSAVERLKHLLHQRSNFVKARKADEHRASEIQGMYGLKDSDPMLKRYRQTAAHNAKMIEQTENEMIELIDAYEALKKNYNLLTSICGIGPVNAWTMIACTSNFERFANARKFGAYCGVVPYEQSSGVFRGKGRVSHLSNHQVKAVLHMAARASVQHDPEMRVFYDRRQILGKHHMGIMNEVMFKLVLRIFAVVRKQEKFVEKRPGETKNLVVSNT
jgi:transposase